MSRSSGKRNQFFMFIEIPFELEPPTLDDSASDLDLLNRGLKKTGCYDVDR
jgi:hypothetical protein